MSIWWSTPNSFCAGIHLEIYCSKENFGNDSQKSLLEFAKSTGPVPALIGFAEPTKSPDAQSFYNSAAWCTEGEIIQTFHKRLLPTYDVFDEKRYFQEGDRSFFIPYKEKSIAVTICEDIWNTDQVKYSKDPLDEIAEGQPDLLINLSASPWHIGKDKQRIKLLGKVAEKCKCPVMYVNVVGGNDELVFDGFSLSVNKDGLLNNFSDSFSEKIKVHDFTDEECTSYPNIAPMESLRKALVLGVRDYAHKSGFKKGLIGLSGGIDSALTAAIAVEALGKENVIGISLPSAISSQHSKEDAEELAKNLGIEFHTLPIQNVVDAASEELAPLFKDRPVDVTEENIQARTRGLLLMAVSNKMGALLLTTGNKSELAVGYCTLRRHVRGLSRNF